jgi:hypothetical protein
VLNLAARRMARTASHHVLCCAYLRHAVRCCAKCLAAFKNSSTNSNDCPQNYFRLETEKACQTLAAMAGANMYGGSEEYIYYPARCFWHTVSRKFYWNPHGSGASNSFAQPLCAGAPARPARPAPPPECVGEWYRVHASSYGSRVLTTQFAIGYSVLAQYLGTLRSGGTRVLGTQDVLGYSGCTRVLGTQEVLGYSVLRQLPGT